jgi:hypothetical protein
MELEDKLFNISNEMGQVFGFNPTYKASIDDGYLQITKTDESGESIIYEKDVDGLDDASVISVIKSWVMGCDAVAIPTVSPQTFEANRAVFLSRLDNLM